VWLFERIKDRLKQETIRFIEIVSKFKGEAHLPHTHIIKKKDKIQKKWIKQPWKWIIKKMTQKH